MDLENIFTNFHERYWKRHRQELDIARKFLPIVQAQNAKTDGNGNLDLKVWQNTLGRTVLIGRVIVWADGYSPSNPFSGGWGAIYSGGGGSNTFDGAAVWDFFPYTQGGQILPNVAEYSGHNAIPVRENETFALHLVSGPVSTNVTCIIYGVGNPYGVVFS